MKKATIAFVFAALSVGTMGCNKSKADTATPEEATPADPGAPETPPADGETPAAPEGETPAADAPQPLRLRNPGVSLTPRASTAPRVSPRVHRARPAFAGLALCFCRWRRQFRRVLQ
jgi:hypothetical protein